MQISKEDREFLQELAGKKDNDKFRLWRRFELKGSQSIWINLKTRELMAKIYLELLKLHEGKKRKRAVNLMRFNEILNRKKEPTIRHALILLCQMKKNRLVWYARKKFKNDNGKPTIIQSIRLK